MAQRTSKSIAERIDVDYYRRTHPLRLWKRRISWWALFLSAIILLVVTFVLKDHRIYQAGPVSDAHALFGADCKQCHTDLWNTGKRLVTLNEADRTVPDATCNACHDGGDVQQMLGAIHHANQVPGEVPDCAQCHREHRGNKALAVVKDGKCVACHKELHFREGTKPELDPPKSVVAFATHPQFRIIEEKTKDPGRILFDHKRHMVAEGITRPAAHGETGADPRQTVQLQCVNCHQPDSERRYMQPINFDKHCADCHNSALTFDAQRFGDKPLKHGLQVEQVRGVLRERYASYITNPANREKELGKSANQARRPVPWKTPPVALDKEEFEWVNTEVQQAAHAILGRQSGCIYCHDVMTDKGLEQAELLNDQDKASVPDGKGVATEIVKPGIPDRWYVHSVFRHDSHRALNCEECHQGVRESVNTSDVLLPGVENCMLCHGAKSKGTGQASGDCVECHLYHNRATERHFDGTYPADPSKWKPRHATAPSSKQGADSKPVGLLMPDVRQWLQRR